MSRRASYFACLLSIRWLFRPQDARELTDPPAPKCAYLWTFTFPDPEARGDPREAMDRWELFRRWLNDSGRLALRVLERGSNGEKAFHFHTVTPEWWDVNHIRQASARHGFGRVNVKAIPSKYAEYVAKYILKQHERRWVPRGMRLWACIGFRGVSAKSIRFVETVRNVVTDTGRDKLYTLLEWWVGDTVAFRYRYRSNDGQSEVIHKMELKPAQSKEVVAKLVSGLVIAVGEFRGVTVRTQKWVDPRTKTDKAGVIIEYNVEFGGIPLKVNQWADEGVKETDVKLPSLARGDVVAVLVDTIKKFAGVKTITGKVLTLPGLL